MLELRLAQGFITYYIAFVLIVGDGRGDAGSLIPLHLPLHLGGGTAGRWVH